MKKLISLVLALTMLLTLTACGGSDAPAAAPAATEAPAAEAPAATEAAAVLTGVESRSSSPVRILRGEDLCSIRIRGLYPCGEGAGYAGGIMSAAVDGIRCAEAVLGDMESAV